METLIFLTSLQGKKLLDMLVVGSWLTSQYLVMSPLEVNNSSSLEIATLGNGKVEYSIWYSLVPSELLKVIAVIPKVIKLLFQHLLLIQRHQFQKSLILLLMAISLN
jgi:hypothetical protein